MRTRLLIGDTLISEKVLLAKPIQETIEVKNRLLDGTYHIQTIGDPAKSWELEFLVPGTDRAVINSYAARKDILTLHRHGEAHTGIIDGNPDWEQVIGSTDPARAVYRCHLVLLEVEA